MKHRFLAGMGLAATLLTGCATGPERPEAAPSTASLAPHDSLLGTLWVQSAAEYAALCEQAYAAATTRLDEALADPTWTAATEQGGRDLADLPPAIVVDVDETVLDNAPYQARLIAEGGSYDAATWASWVEEAQAEPVPGALAFLQAAAERGVTVFYLTNRAAGLEAATRENLAALGFPLADGVDVLLLEGERPDWTSAKTARRAHVAQDHRVLFLCGDDLNDFTSGYKIGDPAQRRALVTEHAGRFGREWILLPNPVYGSWEASLYARDYALDPAERRERMHRHLRLKR
ncbi:MAG: 5'-nucleotidase, lipoprotein e(P4) family [Opitutales bacterium]